MMIRYFFLLTLVTLAVGAKSQNSMSGKVLDSLTHDPIPFVNVYFANTTIGTVTDASGEFKIKGFANGKYNLVISFVGFLTIQKPMDFNNTVADVLIALIPEVIQLAEVSIKADSSDWKENFEIFKSNFLGQTKNASHLEILNPRNLRLFYDTATNVFVAFANHPIEIKNQALGYKIFYQLVDFQIDFKNGRIDYRGIPRFEELEPKGPRELKRWEEARKRAYNGSFNHFIRTIEQNAFEENGFEVNVMTRVPDKSRPGDTFLIDRIAHFKRKLLAARGSSINRAEIIDSLNYYMKKYKQPTDIDIVGRKIIDSRDLLVPDRNDIIRYHGMLQIIFKNESEENNYTVEQPPLKSQRSVINFLKPIKVYENGYYENVGDVFFDGYMAWSEKLAELLPQDYVPVEGNVKE